MKIGFITTIDTNIGDDFIRTGIENIIGAIKDRKLIEFTYVNKHKPETAVESYSPLHILRRMKPFPGRGRLLNFYNKYLYEKFSVYRKQDLIIQSGAPVLWPDCQLNEWAKPIWYNTIGKLKDKIPVLNIAAGACYGWENQDGFTSPREKQYASDIGSFCKLTTTRDRLSNRLFKEAGVVNTLLPCTAFFVDGDFENNESGDYILINYMKGGGHFDWNQSVEANKWESAIRETISTLSKNNDVRFICHNQKEVDEANAIFPNLPVFYPKTVNEYLSVVRKAKLGINNRMHASVAMASVGVPAISICTDTRLLMLENLGLPIFYVKDATADTIINTANGLLSNFSLERERLFNLKRESFTKYVELLKPYIL